MPHAGNLALPASSAAPSGATSPAGNKRIIPNRRARNQARRGDFGIALRISVNTPLARRRQFAAIYFLSASDSLKRDRNFDRASLLNA